MDARNLSDRYEVEEPLGHGGMADVVAATDTRLGRRVAIKVLREDLARDPAFVRRFESEALAAARLNHPGIVSVFDVGEEQPDARGGLPRPFIVMEKVTGSTLRTILDTEGKLPPTRAVSIAADVLNALAYSHEQGVVHNDIKPGNIMISTDGSVRIMDFGIAQALNDISITVSQPDHVLGTAKYMAPELATGERAEPPSDVYALGCVLFEMLAGRPPFQGDSAALVNQHLHVAPPRVSASAPSVPPALEELIDRALAKHPADRPGSARELEISLRGLLNDLKGPRPTTTITGSTAPAGASSAWGAGAAAPAAEEKAFGGFRPLEVDDADSAPREEQPPAFRPLEDTPADAAETTRAREAPSAPRSEGAAAPDDDPYAPWQPGDDIPGFAGDEPAPTAPPIGSTTDVSGSTTGSQPADSDAIRMADTSRMHQGGQGAGDDRDATGPQPLASDDAQDPHEARTSRVAAAGAGATAAAVAAATGASDEPEGDHSDSPPTRAVSTHSGTTVSGTTRLGETGGNPTASDATGPITGRFSRRARREGVPWWAWPVAGLALVGVAAGVAAAIDNWSNERGSVSVPDVRGKSQQEAEEILEDADLEVRIEGRVDEAPLGTVLEQTPGPDTAVERGSAVTLVVASTENSPAPSGSSGDPSSSESSSESSGSDQSPSDSSGGESSSEESPGGNESSDAGPSTSQTPDPTTSGPGGVPVPPPSTPELPPTDGGQPTTEPGPDPTTTEDPGPTTTEPDPTTTEPDPTTTEPDPTTTEPDPTTTEPDPTTTEPDPTTTEPDPTTTEPDPTTTEPDPTTSEPDPTTSEPDPTTSEPDPTTSEPDPTTSEPDPTTSEPDPTTSEPDPTTSEPDPSTSEPDPTERSADPSPSTEPTPTGDPSSPSPTSPEPTSPEPTSPSRS
ncbi:Stk1 family PASTA domain-containing Ser/Thr kinase [Kytococcus sedentarius]|uniref:Stk1 family PASTA domain-containing Ser/Thr kinase n=1 Tax=Kytococcus sedentarius TaxID=1276 RepID=UPI00195018B5|nr:Stk1 family PASTA domain-containing Ser/Thr kinase [Kytococcus sedentarius]QRO87310.1 protein kinase [Kytococcus sedentarius]